MFQNLKITKTTDKITKTNKPYKALEVTDEQGTSHQVNIFSDFPDFANLTVDSVIRGKLEKNGQYENLVSETISKGRAGNPAFKTQQIEKVMERKEASISNFQDNKELSIKMASTMRMAVDLATAEYTMNKGSFDKLEELVPKWREFCWNMWNVEPTQYKPF